MFVDKEGRVLEGEVRYLGWVFCKDKQGKLGFHYKLVSSRTDSEDFLSLVCVRCKYLNRCCPNCHFVRCAFGLALRYKPCGKFRARVLE